MAVGAQLVSRNLGVKAGDAVMVAGPADQIAMLEDIAVQVRKVGAWPYIMVSSDRLDRLQYDSVPPERDADPPTNEVAVARTFPLAIILQGANNPDNLRHVAPERLAARNNARAAIDAQISRIPRKILFVGNNLFPTEHNARLHGLSKSELEQIFWDGVAVNPETMKSTGEAVRTAMRTGGQVRITSPQGTDVTFTLVRTEPYFSDGSVTDADARMGPAGLFEWLPAGEVFVRIAPGSANGTVVADRLIIEGQVIENARFELANGRLTNMTAASGLERLQAFYAAAQGPKDALTVFDIGVNTNMRVEPSSTIRTFMLPGMVTVYFGNDTWAGGTNTASFGMPIFIANSRVLIDDKPIVENGRLVLSTTAM
jgi:leucyl aminopeptidase (aminopeptidase T)